MNYGKPFSRITLIIWSTIAVIFVMWSVFPNPAEANPLFYSAVNYDADDHPFSVAIGDLNGDGHPDLVVANEWSGNVSVLLGNGGGSFQSAVNYGAGGGPHSVAISDFNGNNALDLADIYIARFDVFTRRFGGGGTRGDAGGHGNDLDAIRRHRLVRAADAATGHQ